MLRRYSFADPMNPVLTGQTSPSQVFSFITSLAVRGHEAYAMYGEPRSGLVSFDLSTMDMHELVASTEYTRLYVPGIGQDRIYYAFAEDLTVREASGAEWSEYPVAKSDVVLLGERAFVHDETGFWTYADELTAVQLDRTLEGRFAMVGRGNVIAANSYHRLALLEVVDDR